MASKKDKVADEDRYSILVDYLDKCYICGSTQCVELHEVFFGPANRKKSKEDGMVIPLCGGVTGGHHRGQRGVHNFKPLDDRLKKFAEKVWIKTYTSEEDSKEEKINKFIQRYGKNYLDEGDI